MKEKLFYSDTFNLTPGDFDHHLRLKPYSIFNLFQEVASRASTISQKTTCRLQLETHQKQIHHLQTAQPRG